MKTDVHKSLKVTQKEGFESQIAESDLLIAVSKMKCSWIYMPGGEEK